MLSRHVFSVVFVFIAICTCGSAVLDRTVVVVNGRVILLSEWQDELNFECLASGRKLAEITPEQRKAALDRLIDQELLREQIRPTDVKPIAPEEVQKQIDSIKTDYLLAHTGESWEMAISKYELTEKFIRAHIELELEQLQFVDVRFRSSVQISPDEIEKYYRDQLVPKLPVGDPLSLAEATPKIREILIQVKINQALTSWLQALRAQAQIRIVAITDTFDSGQSRAAAQ